MENNGLRKAFIVFISVFIFCKITTAEISINLKSEPILGGELILECRSDKKVSNWQKYSLKEDKFKQVEPFLIKNKPNNPFLSSLAINELSSNDLTVYRCYDILNKYAETSLSGKLVRKKRFSFSFLSDLFNSLFRPTTKRPPTTTTTTTKPTSEARLKSQCGQPKIQPNLQESRIINGVQAKKSSWPWTVSIGYFGPSTSLEHTCGGTLINKRYVVTATHCVYEKIIYNLVGEPDKNNPKYANLTQMMRVYVGVTKRSTDINESNTYYVEKIISHPKFDISDYTNDLTLIKLKRDVVESDLVSFICLSKNTNINVGTNLIAVGWGYTDIIESLPSDTLMQVKLPVLSKENCQVMYYPSMQFCAGDNNIDKDTCEGDSGGPIMQQDATTKNWVLVGLTSNGDSYCSGNGVYTNIAYYFDWIIMNSII